jgi:Tfp pilus assembly protein PilN
MAIELIPKKEKTTFFQKALFLTSLLIFLAVSFFSIYLFYSISKKETIRNDLRTQYDYGFTSEDKKMEERVLFKKMQIDQLREILSQHKFPSKILEFLEKNLVKDIQLSSLSFAHKGQEESVEIELEARSPSFEDVTLQIDYLKQQPEIKNVSLESLLQDKKGVIEFTLDIIFKKDFLTINP